MSGLGTNIMINVLVTLLGREQISIKETISNILLNMTRTTNNTIYFFSKIKTVSDSSILIKPMQFSKQFMDFHSRTYHEFESWTRFGT